MKKSAIIRRLKQIRRLLNWQTPDGDEFAREEVERLINKLESKKK